MDCVRWCEDRDLRYLLADYTGTTAAEALEVLGEVGRVLAAEPDGAFLLTDIRDAELDRAWVSRARTVTMTVFEPRRTRIAVLGMTDFHLLALRGVQRLDEALDWFGSA